MLVHSLVVDQKPGSRDTSLSARDNAHACDDLGFVQSLLILVPLAVLGPVW